MESPRNNGSEENNTQNPLLENYNLEDEDEKNQDQEPINPPIVQTNSNIPQAKKCSWASFCKQTLSYGTGYAITFGLSHWSGVIDIPYRLKAFLDNLGGATITDLASRCIVGKNDKRFFDVLFSRMAAATVVGFSSDAFLNALGYPDLYTNSTEENLAIKATITAVVTPIAEQAIYNTLRCCGLFKPRTQPAPLISANELNEENKHYFSS